MKKISVLVCFLSLLLLINAAQAVEVTVSPAVGQTYVKEGFAYDVKIFNEEDFSQEFVITVLGGKLEYLNLESQYIRVQPQDMRSLRVGFYPTNEGNYDYEIFVYSSSDFANNASKGINLDVLPERPVRILNFSSRAVGGEAEFSLEVFSRLERELHILFEVKNSEGKIVKYLEMTQTVSGTEEISESISIDDMLAGDYDVEVSIIGYDLTERGDFYVPPKHKIVKRKEVASSIFGQDVTITIANEGNVPEDYTVKESLPATEYVNTETPPSNTYLHEDEVNFNWKIEGLVTGKSVDIEYTISRIPLLVGSIIIIFCVFGILGMGSAKIKSPRIKKSYHRKKDGHKVIIKVKGSPVKGLSNVVVKDRVSPLAKVASDFEGPKPVIRESESGTELIWRLGDIKPRGEIYLNYRINPLVEAQLKMPRAYLTYRTDDDRKMRVYSKQILLE